MKRKLEYPVSRIWTELSKSCYFRGCVCSGCTYKEYCERNGMHMKKEVIALVREKGTPKDVSNKVD